MFCARYTCEGLEGTKVDNIKTQRVFSSSTLATVAHKNDLYLSPTELDEKMAKLHFPALGAALNVLAQEQAEYLSVKVEGHFEGGHSAIER